MAIRAPDGANNANIIRSDGGSSCLLTSGKEFSLWNKIHFLLLLPSFAPMAHPINNDINLKCFAIVLRSYIHAILSSAASLLKEEETILSKKCNFKLHFIGRPCNARLG